MEAYIQALIGRIAKGDNNIEDFSEAIQEQIRVEIEKLEAANSDLKEEESSFTSSEPDSQA